MMEPDIEYLVHAVDKELSSCRINWSWVTE